MRRDLKTRSVISGTRDRLTTRRLNFCEITFRMLKDLFTKESGSFFSASRCMLNISRAVACKNCRVKFYTVLQLGAKSTLANHNAFVVNLINIYHGWSTWCLYLQQQSVHLRPPYFSPKYHFWILLHQSSLCRFTSNSEFWSNIGIRPHTKRIASYWIRMELR